MTNSYQIKFSDQIIPLNKGTDVFFTNSNDNTEIYFFNNNNVLAYKFDTNSQSWRMKLNSTLDIDSIGTTQSKVIHFPKNLHNENILMIKTSRGIDFYQIQNNDLKRLLRSSDFDENIYHDAYQWNEHGNYIKCGHFYRNQSLIGILSKHHTYGVQFNVIMEEELLSGRYPIWSNPVDLNIVRDHSKSNFYFADLHKKGQEYLVIRNTTAMNVYQFNSDNNLEHLWKIENGAKSDDTEQKLLFPDLGAQLRDVVVMNRSGLFMYRYHEKASNYEFFRYNSFFSELTGWNKKHRKSALFADIDGDGIDEMLFTGPRGMDVMAFDDFTNEWNFPLDYSKLSIPQRRSQIVDVIPTHLPYVNDTVVISRYKDELYWGNIINIEEPLEELETSMNETVSENQLPAKTIERFVPLPQRTPPEVSNEKPILLLRDQLDCASMMNPIDKYMGRVSFQVPLIDLSSALGNDIRMNFIYNGNSRESSMMGVGWFLPRNFITMDHQSSIYPNLENYYIVVEDIPTQLVIDLDTSNDTVSSFKLPNNQSPDAKFRYFKNEEKWEIMRSKSKQIYGRVQNMSPDPIIWELTWKNWRGVGSSLADLQKIASSWYLTEIHDENNVYRFAYDVVDASIPGGLQFTREIYLKSITSLQSEVIFNYSQKNANEYDTPPIIDQEGNLRCELIQARYLNGYSILTPTYRQNVDFIYTLIDGKRFLVGIKQQQDPTNEPIFQFFYKKISKIYLIEKAILPTTLQMDFTYDSIGEISLVDEEIGHVRYDVPQNHRVDFIGNEVVITWLDENGKVAFKIFKHEIIIDHSVSSEAFTLLGRGSAKEYETVQGNDFFAIVIYYMSDKVVHLMHKQEKWQKPFEYRFENEDMIRFGDDFVVVAKKTRVLEMISWDVDGKQWKKGPFPLTFEVDKEFPLVLAASKGTFVVYDNANLWLGYKTAREKWSSKKLMQMPKALDSIKTVLSYFYLDTKISQQLIDYFAANALKLNGNLLVLSQWDSVLQGSKLFSRMNLFTLNNKYEIAHQQQFNTTADNIFKIKKEVDIGDGNTLEFHYELHGKMEIIGKDFRGPILKKLEDAFLGNPNLCHSGENDEQCQIGRHQMETYKNELRKNLTDSLGKRNLFDPSKYITFFNPPVVLNGKDKFIFNGNDWKQEQILAEDERTFMKLGEKYILVKDAKSSIRLYEGTNQTKLGNSLANLDLSNFNKIFNAYPVYVAYQANNDGVNMLEFSNKGDFDKITLLPSHEELSSWSTHNVLITIISNLKSQTLVFRQMLGLRRLLPNPVVTKISLHFNDNTRKTGYEYKSPKALGDAVYYQSISVIPGNDRINFGWIEEIQDYGDRSKTHKKIFDGRQNLIKIQYPEPEPDRNNTSASKPSDSYSRATLFDKSGRFQVAEFFINNIDDEEVSYFGFEDYEVNQIGLKNSSRTGEGKWGFKETDIIKNEFSFTGQNHLRLFESSLVGIFQPKQQFQNYIASCWIRPRNETINEASTTTHLKATIRTSKGDEILTQLGEVKYRFDDWYYAEVLVDFPLAREMYVATKNATDQQLENLLRADVIVNSGTNVTIDLDHIRFSPLTSHFAATVYDPKTWQINQEIHADGLIKRYAYDEYQREIASIDDYGLLEELNTYTKSSSTGRLIKLNSAIKINPRTGFYEDFAPNSFKQRWSIDATDSWKIWPHCLYHFSTNSHNLHLNLHEISSTSFGIRAHFSLESENSLLKFGTVVLQRVGNSAEFAFADKKSLIPIQAEILLVAENTRLFVWIDGGLYFDGALSDSSINSIIAKGKVKIRQVFVFGEPAIQITYSNALGEKLQEVVLENESSAIITEYLYDELSRQAITTKPARISRSNLQPLLTYHDAFVTNKNPYSENSVWKTKRLQGESKNTIGEYGYHQTTYYPNPLDEKSAVGLPGEEFSVSGPYSRKFSSSCENLYINNVYPITHNYTHQVELKPGGIKHIIVKNNKKNVVAKYIDLPSSGDLLSTYEYNEEGKLIKALSPLYHREAGTLMQLNTSQQITLESLLQKSLGMHMNYDEKGRVILKKTPDSQRQEHIYDNDLLKFTINFNHDNEIENVLYYNYDDFKRLRETGKLKADGISKENLSNLHLTLNNTKTYQQFHYNDLEHEPALRQNTKRTITYNDGIPLIEESVMNIHEEVLSKRILFPTKDDTSPNMIAINKKYLTGKLMEIEYPFRIHDQPFRLTYQYNKIGKITGIGVPGNYRLFTHINYDASGQISDETHSPNSPMNFTRTYNYNLAGFLTRIHDKFLTEDIQYTENSYGGSGHGDGTITSTKFQATWHEHCDNEDLGINENSFIIDSIRPQESELCFQELKNNGYLDGNNHQAKTFYPALTIDLPIICSYGSRSRQIQSILGKEGFPNVYGHTYDYGNLQELTKAKYFVGDETPQPLQPNTFSQEIRGINGTASRDIWQILNNAGYMTKDLVKLDSSLAQGKQTKSFIRSSLFNDLKQVDSQYTTYLQPLERLLASFFSTKQDISLMKNNLEKAFNKWNTGLDEEIIKQRFQSIVKMLEKNQYLQNPLVSDFKTMLHRYQSFIPDIVRVLLDYFGKQLGESEFDVESYEIDANGNHKLFYTGFDRYELNYLNNTNQIKNIKYQSTSSLMKKNNFAVKHDNRGNVVQALHKGIESIEYNPVSNRAIKMYLVDGRTLKFFYDAQGERVLKRVINDAGHTTSETNYIRDEFGRTLVESKITYISRKLAPDVLITAYIYGPRGLIGFIRRNQFYSVITDHENSVRLVVRGKEVVAAYDYLPYGNFMRKYGNDPESHISYLYTGQELDEETGLYNFHARFYDPSIGRFYQVDPKEQYFSPYKYAGNSPISMIDPDGQFANLLVIGIFALIGAYLGGSAANKTLNPFKWDWLSKKTWMGILFGGLNGAFLPLGFGGSMSAFMALGLGVKAATGLTIALGVGGAYLSMAAANGRWNPGKWHLSAAENINAMFQGFATGSGLVGGLHSGKTFFLQLSTKARYTFAGVAVLGTSLSIVANGNAARWDFTNPAMYYGLLDSVAGMTDLSMTLMYGKRFFSKHGRNAFENFHEFLTKANNGYRLLAITRNGRSFKSFARTLLHKSTWRSTGGYFKQLTIHPFSKSIGKITAGTTLVGFSAFLTGSMANENGWDFSSIQTYQALINGMTTAGQFTFAGRNRNRRKNSQEHEYIPLESIHENEHEIGSTGMKKPHEQLLEMESTSQYHGKEAVLHFFDDIRNYKEWAPRDEHGQIAYNKEVVKALEQHNIPNRVVGILVTEDLIIGAFSRSNAPGFIAYTDRKTGQKHLELLKHNDKIAGKDVVIDDSIITQKKAQLRNENFNEFLKFWNKFEGALKEKFITNGFSKTLTNKLIEHLFTELRKNMKESVNYSPISERDIQNKLQKWLRLQQKTLENIKKKENFNRGATNALLMEGTTPKKWNELSLDRKRERVAAEIDRLNHLDLNDVLLDKNIKSYIKKIEELGEKARKQYPITRDPHNCAEPHCLVALSQVENYLRGRKPVPREEILFMASYETPDGSSWRPFDKQSEPKVVPNLVPIERCNFCKDTTAFVKHFITDVIWIDRIKNARVQAALDKFKFPFLNPIVYTAHTPMEMLNITRRNNSFNIRRKRSVKESTVIDFKNDVMSHEQINSFKSHDTPLITQNTPNQSSRINNWFDWFKNANFFNTTNPDSKLSAVEASLDINGTLLLLDLLVRKVTGSKPSSLRENNATSLLEAQAYALNIIEKFEDILYDVAIKLGIPETDLNFDPIQMQKILINQLSNGNASKISETLFLHAKKANPHLKRNNLFLIKLKDELEEIFKEKKNIILPRKEEKDASGLRQVSNQQSLITFPKTISEKLSKNYDFKNNTRKQL